MQSNLKWNKHIDNITSNASRQLNFLKRNLKVASPEIKERADQSLVRPKLKYNCCTWDLHHQSQIHQLELVQHMAARYVTNRFHNTSSGSDMMQHLNWPTLQQRRLQTRLIFLYKIVHNIVAIYPTNLLYPLDNRTRHQNPYGFQHIQTNNDTYKYFLSTYSHSMEHRFHRQVVCLQRTGYNTCSSNHFLLTQSQHVHMYIVLIVKRLFYFIPCHRACYRHIIVKVDGTCLSQRRRRRIPAETCIHHHFEFFAYFTLITARRISYK